MLQASKMKGDELAKKREEAERKARRGEIDPTHEFTFQLIGQFSGLLRHEIMDYMFNDPAMLDDLDFLYKSDNARKILFYFQPEEVKEDEDDKMNTRRHRTQRNITVMQKKDEEKKPAKKILFTTDGTKVALNGYCMYFLRTSTKRNLGEETFQVRELTFISFYFETLFLLQPSLKRHSFTAFSLVFCLPVCSFYNSYRFI